MLHRFGLVVGATIVGGIAFFSTLTFAADQTVPSSKPFSSVGNDGSSLGKTLPVATTRPAIRTFDRGIAPQPMGRATDTSPLPSNTAATIASAACNSIESYGGVGNGTTDNVAAWNAAVAAAGTGSPCIKFGPGIFVFSSKVSATPNPTASISIFGSGKNVTRLRWGQDGGMVLNTGNQQAVFVSDLAFESTVSANAGTALTVNSSDCTGSNQSSYFNNLSFTGSDSYPHVYYWSNSLVLNTLSFVNIAQSDFFGDTGNHPNGILFRSTNAPACYALILNITQSNFINMATGLDYGTYAQGVTISQSNFTNGLVGIILRSTAASTAQLNVSDSQFNVTNSQIIIEQDLLGGQFHHNTFTVPEGYAGISIKGGAYYTIDHNIFFLNNGNKGNVGVQVLANLSAYGAVGGTINGNVYANLNTGNSFAAGTSGWNVQSNSYGPTVGTKNGNAGGTANSIGKLTE